MHPALTVALYALAVARLSVLVTEDRLTKTPREWALAKLNDRHWREFKRLAGIEIARIEREPYTSPPAAWEAALDKAGKEAEARKGEGYLEYLLTCQWCVSIWVGVPAVVVWWNWPTAWWSLGPVLVLAWSMVTGKLAQWGS